MKRQEKSLSNWYLYSIDSSNCYLVDSDYLDLSLQASVVKELMPYHTSSLRHTLLITTSNYSPAMLILLENGLSILSSLLHVHVSSQL